MNSSRKTGLGPAHHTLYLALIGKDWRRGFTPMSNPRRLANGGWYEWGLFGALRLLHSEEYESALLAPFDGLATAAMLHKVREMIPLALLNNQRPKAYAGGSFPFDAYALSPASVSQPESDHA
jgi:hypothetical protein